jgi:hypothetical protein
MVQCYSGGLSFYSSSNFRRLAPFCVAISHMSSPFRNLAQTINGTSS